MAKNNDHFWRSGKGLVAGIFIAAVSYFLLIEHRQHFFEYLPYMILLACPLMHVFMHHGHGSHDQSDNPDIEEQSRPLSFKEKQQKNSDYRDGYIEGIKVAREERDENKEKDDAR